MPSKKQIKISDLKDSKIEIVGKDNIGGVPPESANKNERSRMAGDITTDAPPPDDKKKKKPKGK